MVKSVGFYSLSLSLSRFLQGQASELNGDEIRTTSVTFRSLVAAIISNTPLKSDIVFYLLSYLEEGWDFKKLRLDLPHCHGSYTTGQEPYVTITLIPK